MKPSLKRKTPEKQAVVRDGSPKRQKTDVKAVTFADPALDEQSAAEDEENVEIDADTILDEDLDEDEDDAEDESSGSDEDSAADSDDEFLELDETKGRNKRHDPAVFATSISKILSAKTKISQSQQKDADPVLSRSRDAVLATKEISTSRLENEARKKIRDERRRKLDRGRIVDVMGLESTDVSTSGIMERERKYKKMAQRGAVLLFNAIRAAQKEAEKAAEANGEGGRLEKEEKVTEMSKKGFLELIAGGGKR
jgi:mitochondrial fusion and transport protein UGO1